MKFLLAIALLFSSISAFAAEGSAFLCCEKVYCNRAQDPGIRQACLNAPFGSLPGQICGYEPAPTLNDAIFLYNRRCMNNSNWKLSCWWHRDCREVK